MKKPTHLMSKGDTYLLVRPGAEKDDGIVRLCWVTDSGVIIYDEGINWVLSLDDIVEECL